VAATEITLPILTLPSQQHQIPKGPDRDDLRDQVDDFKWLKTEHSPNWDLLSPEDTVLDDTWREIVPGGPGWTLDDILKATKVVK
jgi:hypothetical protein